MSGIRAIRAGIMWEEVAEQVSLPLLSFTSASCNCQLAIYKELNERREGRGLPGVEEKKERKKDGIQLSLLEYYN